MRLSGGTSGTRTAPAVRAASQVARGEADIRADSLGSTALTLHSRPVGEPAHAR
ncbi:MAG: hypothetical protein RL227_1489 [Pseudomonadota bacterium]|jgi:hypothetical protein